MSPEEFLREFGHLAETEGGILALREMVLQLAVGGRLSGSSMAAGSSGSWRLPAGWKWVLPDELAAPARHALTIGPFGSSLLKSDYRDEGVPLVFVREVTSRNFGDSRTRYISQEKAGTLAAHVARAGDLLITKMGSPPGDTAIYPSDRPPAVVTSDVVKWTPNSTLIGVRFLQVLVESPLIKSAVLGITKGVAHQKISLKRLRSVQFPIPSLPEQKRIVEKVDQLMALCDELEAKQKQKREKAVSFNKAALNAVVHASDKSKLKSSWSRVQDHFEVLYDLPENVKELRQVILELAVMGKLVRQDLQDGHARDLQLTAGRYRENILGSKASSFREIPEDLPFTVPTAWTWSRLGSLAWRVQYGTSEKAHARSEGVPVLRMGNIVGGALDYENLKYVPETVEGLTDLLLEPGDLVFNRTNSFEQVGKMAVFDGSRRPMTLASYLIRVSMCPGVLPDYINAYFASPICRSSQIEPAITKQTNQANFNGTKLQEVLVPLPPSAEQARIVEKVDQLMSLCGSLEHRLSKCGDSSQRLMSVAVESMVAG